LTLLWGPLRKVVLCSQEEDPFLDLTEHLSPKGTNLLLIQSVCDEPFYGVHFDKWVAECFPVAGTLVFIRGDHIEDYDYLWLPLFSLLFSSLLYFVFDPLSCQKLAHEIKERKRSAFTRKIRVTPITQEEIKSENQAAQPSFH